MSVYCELKLIDVLKEEKRDMTKKNNKTKNLRSSSLERLHSKLKLGNLSTLNKNSAGLPADTTTNLAESKLKNKSNTQHQAKNINCGDLRKMGGPIPENKAGKRRNSDQVENIEEPKSKRICSRSKHTISTNKPEAKTSRNRKTKRKPRESFWENKLTGARRVSKRLSNLRIKNKKSLKDLGISGDEAGVLIKSRQAINFSARSSITGVNESRGKSNKRCRNSYISPEVQINFGKLSFRPTKRLYPKISSGRRPGTYTVTIKSPGSSQQNSRANRIGNFIVSSSYDDDLDDVDLNSLINKSFENIQDDDDIDSGTENEEISTDTHITVDGENVNSNEPSQPNEVGERNNVELVLEEVQTLVCDSDNEDFDNGSSGIIIVDIESGENIECTASIENKVNKENPESVRSGEGRKPEEKHVSFEKPSQVQHEGVTVTEVKQSETEDKSKSDEKSGLRENGENTKTETTREGKSTEKETQSSFVTEVIQVIDKVE